MVSVVKRVNGVKEDMANNKDPKDPKKDELTVFDPGLPDTPGWSSLSDAKKRWLQEKTSNIKKLGAMRDLASVSGGIELVQVKHGLKDEAMTLTSYLKTVYGKHERTGWRTLKETEKLIKLWPDDVIRYVAEHGALLLQGTAGIGVKDLQVVAKELPAPKERDGKTLEGFVVNKVRPKLLEKRVDRRKGKSFLTEEDVLNTLFIAGHRVFARMKGVTTSAARARVIKTVVGWWMANQAIPGKIECKQIQPPEGILQPVGRPRGKGKKSLIAFLAIGGGGLGLYLTIRIFEHMATAIAGGN